MENFKEFLTSNVGNSQIIVWWMLLVAIVAVVIILCVIAGIVWTRMDKKHKASKAAAAQSKSTDKPINDEPVISVTPSEQTVEPELPATVETAVQDSDDGVINLAQDDVNICTASDKTSEESDADAVAAAVVADNEALTSYNNDIEIHDSEDDMGLFKKKNKAAETEKIANTVAIKTEKVETPEKNDVKTVSSEQATNTEANKSADKAPVKAVPIAKKMAPISKGVTGDDTKKAKVVVGTEALPKSVKKNIKLNEIKNAAPAPSNETFGKYFIIKDERNSVKPFKFELRANNGQLLFESEPYKVKPRENSIEAFKKHVNTGEFVVDEDKFGFFRFKLYTDAGKLLGVGESYKSRPACVSSIESVKRFSLSATVVEDTTIDKEIVKD